MNRMITKERFSGVSWLIIALIVFSTITVLQNGLSDITSIATASSNTSDTYWGAEICGLCHQEQYLAWNQSYHNNLGLINITDGVIYYWMSPPWLHNGTTRVYTQDENATEGFSCANCHTTGYDPLTNTWPGWNSTDPEEAARLLGVQCEVCHGIGMEMSINYASEICGQCHTGSHGQYEDVDMSSHNSSLQDAMTSPHLVDSCLTCHSAQGYLSEAVTTTSGGLEPISCVVCHSPHDAMNEAQLREETPTDTCGTCHDYPPQHTTEYPLYIMGPHEKAGVECTDCHGQGSHYAHGSEAAYFNHTFAIYGTYLPYNQSDPLVCGQCHDQSWATQQLGIIQETIGKTMTNVTQAIDDAEKVIAIVSQVNGVEQSKITQAQVLVDSATSIRRYVNSDLSLGFHNPELSYSLMSEAWQLANEAQALADSAHQEALTTQLRNAGGPFTTTQLFIIGAAAIVSLIIGLFIGRRVRLSYLR